MVGRHELLEDVDAGGDYGVETEDGEFDRHCVLAAPWIERRRDGSAAAYLPISPRTLQPAPFARAFREWQDLPHGIRGRSTASGAPGLWDYDQEAATNVRLARLRVGLAYVRRDASHMARWMDRNATTAGERGRRVFDLFFLQGYRRRSIANKLGILPRSVDSTLARLRSQAGSPVRDGAPLRMGALLPLRKPLVLQQGLNLQPVIARATGSPAG